MAPRLVSWLKSKVPGMLGEVLPMALALSVVLVVRTVAAEPFSVPSASMVPTILVGDNLIAGKYTYGYSKFSSPIGLMPDFKGRILEHAPERGDVIVFKLPRDTSVNYVKRLIGLPGDRIQMKSGRLYINGEMVPRTDDGTYTTKLDGQMMKLHRYIETLPGGREHETLEISDNATYDNTAEFEVPQGFYFMMGDNRDDSLDSRVAAADGGVGFVPEENLVGRVDRIMYSRDPDVHWWQLPEFAHAFRPERFFAAVD
jgi:signal peptidase I